MELRSRYRTLIDLFVLFIVVFLITIGLKHYFKPILFMMIIILFCNPMYKFFVKLNIPNKLSGAMSIFFINVLLILIIITVGNSIYNLIIKIYNSNIDFIESQLSQIYILIKDSSKLKIIQKLLSLLSNANITTSAASTGDGIFAYVIGNISAFFVLIDKEKINELIKRIIPREILEKSYKQKEILKKMIVVQFNLILISTTLIIVGFAILRVPSPFLLGIICGILDLLPYVGTIIVFIPIIIYNIIVKDYFVVVGVICLYILVQVVREILEAKFLSDKLDIHPLLIILSVYIGVKLFGFLGIIVGPMYGILAKEIIYSREI